MQTNQTYEEQYLAIMREILETAEVDPDRTGTGRARIFARDIRVDLSDGSIAAITTRKLKLHHAIHELLWMISGSYNLKDLDDSTKVIWKNWAVTEQDVDAFIEKRLKGIDEKARETVKQDLLKRNEGSIGRMYGYFWRNNPAVIDSIFMPFDSLNIEDIPSDKMKKIKEKYDEFCFLVQSSNPGVPAKDLELPPFEIFAKKEYFDQNDQLGEVIRGIKLRPYSARHVISSWIPQFVPFESVLSPQENVLIGRGSLTACHGVPIQFFVKKARDGGPDHISLRVNQRSCDWALGVCTNLVFYSVFLHLVAHVTGLRSKELIWSGGDCHLYGNHLETARHQVTLTPLTPPKLKINPEAKDIFAMKFSDFEIVDYQHHPHLKYDVST